MLTIGQYVERLAVGVHGGETGGLWGDGAPPLQGRLQRRGPVGYHAQRLAPHGHHLGPLGLGLVGVWLLDWRNGRDSKIRFYICFSKDKAGNIQRFFLLSTDPLKRQKPKINWSF